MKKQHYLFINILFIALMLLAASVVIQFMTGYKITDAFSGLWPQSKVANIQTDQCSTKSGLNLSGSDDPSIQKLAVYQQACRSYVTDTLMLFTSMPPSADEARIYAKNDAETLKKFANRGIRPIIIYEPSDKTGAQLDFGLLANGSFNAAIEAYFKELKSLGISDKQLGIINPLPEANLPYWNNNRPEFFGPAVNNFLSIARAHFPAVETSVLLNSATYDVNDFNWENGDYNSLLPYVKSINPSLINYAGIQGFPWISRQGGNGVIFNAAEFVNPSLLDEMAEQLKTKKVWVNTGTFSRKYTLDADQLRTITAEQRKDILQTIMTQAISLKDKGYSVSINIFAEDKSQTSEETDWSYWQNNDPTSSADASILTSFIKELDQNSISFWLFDR